MSSTKPSFQLTMKLKKEKMKESEVKQPQNLVPRKISSF